jgi:hypothetical protein
MRIMNITHRASRPKVRQTLFAQAYSTSHDSSTFRHSDHQRETTLPCLQLSFVYLSKLNFF